MTSPQDRNWHWDGTGWLWWNGTQWQRVESSTQQVEQQPQSAENQPGSQPVAAPANAAATREDAPTPTGGAAAGSGGSGGLRLSGGPLIAVLSVFALLIALVGGGVVYLLARDSGNQAGQTISVTTEPISSAIDPFSPTGSTGTDVPVTPVEPATSVQVPGGKAGLYGGTLKTSQCDKLQLTTYLAANPDKATAWAQVQGIGVDAIPTFVNKLTSVVLRSDTMVVNHGFANGKATTFTSVLQAGTAVLVNDQGLPVVKCYCGNPLTAAPVDPGPISYQGPTWPAWNPQRITVVQANPTVITNIILINVTTNEPFSRPVGTDGAADAPTTLPPADGSTSPAPTAPPTSYTGEQAYAIFLAALDKCVARLDDGSFNGLRKNPGAYKITKTPGKVNGVFIIAINNKKGSEATYKFVVNVPKRTVVPGNEAGASVAKTCKELDTG